jgi:hypothetical protein
MNKGQSMRMNVALTQHPEHAAQIANIITLWNATEHACGSLFATLVGIDPWHAGKILGALVASSAKISLVEAAGKHTLAHSTQLNAFVKLISELKSISKIRNKYAHGVYAIDENNCLNIIRQGRDWQNQEGRTLVQLSQVKRHWTQSVQAFNHVIRFQNLISEQMPKIPQLASMHGAPMQDGSQAKEAAPRAPAAR